jgi:hypothetical protein
VVGVIASAAVSLSLVGDSLTGVFATITVTTLQDVEVGGELDKANPMMHLAAAHLTVGECPGMPLSVVT